jgi:hypothetical protein
LKTRNLSNYRRDRESLQFINNCAKTYLDVIIECLSMPLENTIDGSGRETIFDLGGK